MSDANEKQDGEAQVRKAIKALEDRVEAEEKERRLGDASVRGEAEGRNAALSKRVETLDNSTTEAIVALAGWVAELAEGIGQLRREICVNEAVRRLHLEVNEGTPAGQALHDAAKFLHARGILSDERLEELRVWRHEMTIGELQ